MDWVLYSNLNMLKNLIKMSINFQVNNLKTSDIKIMKDYFILEIFLFIIFIALYKYYIFYISFIYVKVYKQNKLKYQPCKNQAILDVAGLYLLWKI